MMNSVLQHCHPLAVCYHDTPCLTKILSLVFVSSAATEVECIILSTLSESNGNARNLYVIFLPNTRCMPSAFYFALQSEILSLVAQVLKNQGILC